MERLETSKTRMNCFSLKIDLEKSSLLKNQIRLLNSILKHLITEF